MAWRAQREAAFMDISMDNLHGDAGVQQLIVGGFEGLCIRAGSAEAKAACQIRAAI